MKPGVKNSGLSDPYWSAFVAVSFLLLYPQSAHAYLDPATGMFVIQAVVAGVITMIGTSKLWWSKFKDLIGRGVSSEDKSIPTSDE